MVIAWDDSILGSDCIHKCVSSKFYPLQQDVLQVGIYIYTLSILICFLGTHDRVQRTHGSVQ